jgi:glycosyltransferase involved in cell wall biosynthesis
MVIAVSDAVRDHTGRYLGLSSAKIRTIRHGVDTVPFARVTAAERDQLRAEWGASNETVVVGTVGRFVAQKSLHILLEGFALYRAASSRSARLVMVGYGGLESVLKARAIEIGLADEVVWTGFRDDIPTVMTSFDIVALSSKCEGFGLVLLEAMAAGKPIVATNASAIPEIVEDGVNGLLIPVDDPVAFSASFKRLEDASLRARLGAAGRSRAGGFTMNRMVDATLAAYAEVLNGRD